LTQQAGFSIGSSVGDELSTTIMPAGYLKRMGFSQQTGWTLGLNKIERLLAKRYQTAEFYDDFFKRKGIPVPLQPDYAKHGMLRYVIRVPDKERILQRARKRHIPIGDWFISPLHPVENDLEPWQYQKGQCPESEKACRETINLFTDHALSENQLNTLLS
jgi:dTDP-4-amino-4,6-dideoxygalactose transaminase